MASNSSTPLVSVILPAYNAERHIRETLATVLAQTYTNFEVLCVDDGSTDQTASILESVAEADSRVRLIRQSNSGVAAARNRAIAESSGEFVAPIDSDDLWHPDKLLKQVATICQSGPQAGLCYCWWMRIDEDGMPNHRSLPDTFRGEVFDDLLCRNFIGNASVPLIRRKALDVVGGYRADLKERGGQGCEDFDLSLRIAERFTFDVLPQFLVAYRDVHGSMSQDSSMRKSYELMIGDLKLRRPGIPQRHYRTSKCHFLLYLARISLDRGSYRRAIQQIGEAFLANPRAAFPPTVAAAWSRLVSSIGMGAQTFEEYQTFHPQERIERAG